MDQVLETLMTYDWRPQFTEGPNGVWEGRISQIKDFRIYGTHQEVSSEWRDALRAHLEAYLKTGKVLPVPVLIPPPLRATIVLSEKPPYTVEIAEAAA